MKKWKSSTGQTANQKWRSMNKSKRENMLKKKNFSKKFANYEYNDLTTNLKKEVQSYKFRNTKSRKNKR